MTLQTSTSTAVETSSSFFDSQLLFAILSMIALSFITIVVAKLLSEINLDKTSKKEES